ncbi:MAG: hypothetical protein ND866_32640 [Pyrinomonadaceae bacterium]|nr:hypothetical protein [Pyrinomonadaceae bacterium]
MAKPIEVVDVSSVNATTKIKKETPKIMGVTRSFGKNPNKLIKANNVYTPNIGINVVNQQATTSFQYPRVVLEDDNCVELKELKFLLVWLTGKQTTKGIRKGVRMAHATITCDAGEASMLPVNQNEPGTKLAHSSNAHQSSV